MALKPTIYKFRIAVSDVDRNVYQTLNLTVAQHPSETVERMMARIMAFCLNAEHPLTLTKGLSTSDEPDIWFKSDDDQIVYWIELGEPEPDRIKKASRRAKRVKIYSFNSKSDVWWQQFSKKFAALAVDVYRFDWQQIGELSKLVSRTMEFSVTISDQSLYVATQQGECQVSLTTLQQQDL